MPCAKVIPLEKLLRDSWRSKKYLKSALDTKKPFLVEDGSKAHIQRINGLMDSDYDWCCIRMVSALASSSDMLGSWTESCPCPEIHPPSKQAAEEAQACPFRCCRAPELAAGHGLSALVGKLQGHKSSFVKELSAAPTSKQTELNSSWSVACSKLYGSLPFHSVHCSGES